MGSLSSTNYVRRPGQLARRRWFHGSSSPCGCPVGVVGIISYLRLARIGFDSANLGAEGWHLCVYKQGLPVQCEPLHEQCSLSS